MKQLWDAGLTTKEYAVIGDIVAQWGALEAEIFSQTLITYGSDIHISQLPNEMSNLNFLAVLKLWKIRVVDVSESDCKSVLEGAYTKILQLQDVRNSIIHGMWEFSPTELKTISTFRVKKDKLINIVFKDGALVDIAIAIAEINACIRYPGGMADFFKEHDGFYVNQAFRRRMKLETGNE